MRAIAVAALPSQHEIECYRFRDLGAHAKLVIGTESMRERNAVAPADDDAVGRQRTLPDPTLDTGIDVLRWVPWHRPRPASESPPKRAGAARCPVSVRDST